MDLFDDMEFNDQLDRLEQLDELRAEIHMDMDIELNVGQLGDPFDLRVDREENIVNPQPEGMEQAAGDVPGRNRQEAGNLGVGAGDPEVQPVENQNGAASDTGESTNKPSEDNLKEDRIEAILTPKGTEMKGFSCMICYDPFNTGKRIPKVFPCGHTFCLSCVGGLMKNRTYLSRSTVVCPTCRQNTQYPMTLNPEKVPTNYSVLCKLYITYLICYIFIIAMLEQRKEESNAKTEKEMLECNTCHEVLDGEKVTLCNESECQNISDEGKLLGTDSIVGFKRMKCLLVCSTCIEKNHSRHNFTPFVKVVAQYEANQKICSAESNLVKAFKAADDALIGLKLAETELLDHRRRMTNAIENIRSQADHPMIYEYLNRFTTSVKASEQLFKRLTGDMNGFDFISKSRYYRAFGNDSLRPISITPINAGSKGALEPKQEPVDEANIRPRVDRVPRGLNRDMARRARVNVFGPFHARRAGALGPDMDFPNIGNMFDQIMQQLDVAVDPFGGANRGLFGQPAENAANAVNDANAAPANIAGAEPQNNAAVQDPAQIRGARNPLGNRFDMWGVRAPWQHRRNVRNENWRDFRGIRLRLEAARDANAALQVPEIQQVIDDLRDRGDNILDNDLRGRRPPLLHPHADMVREFELAEGHLNRLRVRLDRLNRDNVRDEHPLPPADVAEPAPVRFVDQIIDEPLPQLPPIDGYNQEQIQRAEIVELVRRVSAMVRNEAHAEADANGQPLPNNYRLPLLLNPDENPGAPDHRNLLPHQVEPFLIDLRALELEWIQRGRDRRARAALVVQEAAQVNQPANDAEAENNVVRGNIQTCGNQRVPSPIPDEPAAKRHRR
ncbi:Protein CBG12045 [Caenorhabditis briggsae]|uniref:Protein CBG12045 n=1 Tax=Caenorhabditis briggsae TaxID=6238 RepID=A8XEF1_CAEBR|nr:Protein CBG12045 [Caenorhabditis briggsae]CAP31086.2 Protein CBG12045 [Caenorhabditis briggsae]